MTQEIIKKADQVIAKTYKRFPIVIAKGKGCTLWDTQGKKYTDFVAGIAGLRKTALLTGYFSVTAALKQMRPPLN
jgi:acetylornithine/succinyldiaminopimelate/putrescine aminotransferase